MNRKLTVISIFLVVLRARNATSFYLTNLLSIFSDSEIIIFDKIGNISWGRSVCDSIQLLFFVSFHSSVALLVVSLQAVKWG